MHCGYEPTAVAQGFGSLRGFLAMAKLSLFGDRGRPEPAPEHYTSDAFGRSSAAPVGELLAIDISKLKPVAVRDPDADYEPAGTSS